jgi:hypothetical protein
MVNGSRLIRDTRIQRTIEEILEEADASYEVRLNDLIDLARGKVKVETVTEQYDSDNTLQSKQLATRDVSPADRIKALKLLSDLTGETQASRARGEILSKALKAKSAEMLKRVEKSVGAGAAGGPGGGGATIHSPSQIADSKNTDPPLDSGECTDLGIIREEGEFDGM